MPTCSAGACSSTPVLLSRGKAATQSSTYYDGTASYVAGRGDDGSYSNFQHTVNELNPWWRVDLGAVYTLVRVDIWNRNGYRSCPAHPDCARDSQLDIQVSDNDVTWTNIGYLADIARYPSSVTVSATGRYIRVRSRQTNILDMAEVEVWGY